jgi:hypothetical protein
MSDRVLTPPAHDGMAVVSRTYPRCSSATMKCWPGTAFAQNSGITYDPPAEALRICLQPQDGKLEQSWASLIGTSTNCPGGATYASLADLRRRWTCTTRRAGGSSRSRHSPGGPVPLTAMGRCARGRGGGRRRASCTRPRIAARRAFIAFFRRTRTTTTRAGVYQMLKVVGAHQADLRGGVGVGPRSRWSGSTSTIPSARPFTGTTSSLGVFLGLRPGGAVFSRLEGASYNHKNKRVLRVDGRRKCSVRCGVPAR